MYEKLVSYAASQLELNADEITRESTFESLGVDSLDIVEMLMELESELGVEHVIGVCDYVTEGHLLTGDKLLDYSHIFLKFHIFNLRFVLKGPSLQPPI